MARREETVFKAVVNDTDPDARGRSYAVTIGGSNFNNFLGKRIGDIVDGLFVGEGERSLAGYKLRITGGSDLTGTPMRPDVEGGQRSKVLVSQGKGFSGKNVRRRNGKVIRYKMDGIRRRRPLRGNVITQNIVQLNLAVAERGNKPLEDLLGKKSD